MHMSWEDIRTVEALVRTGSLTAAATELGLRHTSISRRIDALESSLGAPLFLRGAKLVATSLARSIAEEAQPMVRQARGVEDLLEAERRRRERRITVTSNDVLSRLIFNALARHPLDALVEVKITDEEIELSPGITDLALRPGPQPKGELRGWRLGRLRVGIYRSAGLIGEPPWIQPSPELRSRSSMKWWRAVPVEAPARVECDSLLAVRDACVAGLGLAVLPALMAADDPRLRLEREIEAGPVVWLLASATRRSDPALREVAEGLAGAIRGAEGVWAG